MIFIRFLFLILISFRVNSACKIDDSDTIEIGLRIPLWGFMWKDGKELEDTKKISKSEKMKWRLALENLDTAQELGAKWNIVRLFQESDGPDGWLRAKKIVSEHNKRGLDVAFRLMEKPGIYDDNRKSKDSKYGYNKRYYDWVKSLVNNFSGDVSYILIGNEMDHGGEYRRRSKSEKVSDVTYADYNKLLETAILAVKSTNNNIKILDHGVSSQSLGLWVTEKELSKQGYEVGLQLWNNLNYNRENKSWSKSSFSRRFASPRVQKRLEFVDGGLSSNANYDFQQIHYYWSWEALNKVLDEIDNQKPSDRKIIAGEVGYRVATQKIDGKKKRQAISGGYDEDDHARGLVKKFAILHGRDVTRALYWNIRPYNSGSGTKGLFPGVKKVGLLKPTLPAKAYSVLTESLNGMRAEPVSNNYSSNIYDYRFSCGKDNVAILWVDENKNGLDYELDFEPLSAHDKYAKPVELIGSKIKLSSDPVYIWWKE